MAINDSKPILAKVNDSKDFYFSFFQMFREQLKIKSMTDIHVMTSMCMMMEFNSTTVKLTTSDRKLLCEEIGIQNTHLSNSLRRLKELQLIDGGDGVYEVSPFLAWKGSLNEREKLLATKGIEIRVRFAKTVPDEPYNPLRGGSKEFDA